jgi:hypothetical protein
MMNEATSPEVTQDPLYQAILRRRSVRRYDTRPLPESTLERVREWVGEADPLVPENRFTVLLRDVETTKDLVQALGAYGRLLSPPHYMVPYVIGKDHPLEDLGYRTQQVVIRMTERGVGTCYIGSLGRETTLRARFILRRDARIGAVVLFGRPADAVTGRAINKIMRQAMGATDRLPVTKLFHHGAFDNPTRPSERIAPLIEAGRQAPSALNTQPWRFLWRDGGLYLFVVRENPSYGKGVKQHYRKYEAGICMANISLVLDALGMEGSWRLLDKDEEGLPTHPEELEPAAHLDLT